eukprot:g4323.t1
MAKNAQLELKASATTLAIWDWSDRLLYGAHVFWMIKEIGWVLLVPEICLPAGLAAGLLMIIGVIAHACRRDFANVLPEMVMCIWLCSNVTWMASEVLMDDPDAKFSWHLCPVLHGDHQSEYDTMSVMVADGFLLSAGLYVLGVAYLICVHRRLKGPVGRVLLQCYLCSWCLKDYFWADEDFWPAISTDLVTVPMLLYNIHLESGPRRSMEVRGAGPFVPAPGMPTATIYSGILGPLLGRSVLRPPPRTTRTPPAEPPPVPAEHPAEPAEDPHVRRLVENVETSRHPQARRAPTG